MSNAIKLNSGMSVNDELAMVKAQLAAEQAKNKARSNRPLTMKVSLKKALSVYGLGRFPVTLYKEQWLKLLAEDIKGFIADHDSELHTKEQSMAAKALAEAVN